LLTLALGRGCVGLALAEPERAPVTVADPEALFGAVGAWLTLALACVPTSGALPVSGAAEVQAVIPAPKNAPTAVQRCMRGRKHT